jgi:hypothetical protein
MNNVGFNDFEGNLAGGIYIDGVDSIVESNTMINNVNVVHGLKLKSGSVGTLQGTATGGFGWGWKSLVGWGWGEPASVCLGGWSCIVHVLRAVRR